MFIGSGRVHDAMWKVALLWPLVLVITFMRAPRATIRYWREGLRRFGRRVARRFYLDAIIIALAPDIRSVLESARRLSATLTWANCSVAA